MNGEMMTKAEEDKYLDLIMQSNSGSVLASLLGRLSVNGVVTVEDFKEVLMKHQVVED